MVAGNSLLARLAVPGSIVLLPLAGFAADRLLGEEVTGLTGPALYTLYGLVVLAYGVLLLERSPLRRRGRFPGDRLCGGDGGGGFSVANATSAGLRVG